MQPVKLNHIAYASIAVPEVGSAEIEAILRTAHTHNAQRSVTGMLLYTSGCFFQVIEGEPSTLTALFARIAADPRHRSVVRIIEEPIAQRSFGEWTMGYLDADATELQEIDGLRDAFQAESSLVELAPGRAKKLLTAFAEGRWRARLKGHGP